MNTLILHENNEVHQKFKIEGHTPLFNPKEFNTFSLDQMTNYNNYVDQLNLLNGDSPHWWASSISSRNIFFSQFFLDWCYLHYALEISSKIPVDLIICESVAMSQAFRSNPTFKKNKIKIYQADGLKNKLKKINIINYLYSSYSFIKYNLKLNSAASKTFQKTVLPMKVYLVDTFVTEGNLRNNQFYDIYYNKLLKGIPDQNMAYLPYLFEVKNICNCFKIIRNNKIPFIIKEDYLGVYDYFWALISSYKIFNIKFPEIKKVNCFNYTKIVEFNNSKRFNRDTINFLLLYRLPKKLIQNNIKVVALLDWYEAQPLDHVQNLAFKTYFPKIKTSSYIGAFFSQFQAISYQVIPSQVSFRVSGDNIFLQGEEIKNKFLNMNGIKYFSAPASRFEPKKLELKHTSGEKVFIVLPNMLPQAKEVISFLSQSNLQAAELTISIHPKTDTNYIKRIINNELANKYKIDYVENLTQYIHQAKVIISTGTSAFVDAFQFQIPCIVTGSQTCHTLNFIPDEYENKLFSINYNPKQMNEDIEKIVKTAQDNIELFYLFVNDYIQLPTDENVKKFQANIFSNLE